MIDKYEKGKISIKSWANVRSNLACAIGEATRRGMIKEADQEKLLLLFEKAVQFTFAEELEDYDLALSALAEISQAGIFTNKSEMALKAMNHIAYRPRKTTLEIKDIEL